MEIIAIIHPDNNILYIVVMLFVNGRYTSMPFGEFPKILAQERLDLGHWQSQYFLNQYLSPFFTVKKVTGYQSSIVGGDDGSLPFYIQLHSL